MSKRSFATFKLDGRLFGLDILLIREINRHLELTHVPHAPAHVRGLVNLRGQIVTVVDLRERLGMPPASLTHESHNIVLKTDQELTSLRLAEQVDGTHLLGDKVGLLVDAIGDVVSVDADEVHPLPVVERERSRALLSGVVHLQQQLLSVLDVNSILTFDNN